MKRVSLILLILLLMGVCAHAEQVRYPTPGEDLPQLHALIVSGASKVKTVYWPVKGCEDFYEALAEDKIHVEVQPQNLFYHSYDSEESVGGLPSCTRETFKGWLDEAFGQSEDGDLNLFYYCGHTAGIQDQSDTYGAMCSDHERYPYRDLAQDLAAYQGDFLVFIDACFAETFETEGLAQLDEDNRSRFTLVYSAVSDASAWMGSMTNAIAKGARRSLNGELNADDKDGPDDMIHLMELYDFIQNDANDDGILSPGETLGRITNTGAAELYISSGTNWCLFQFSSVEVEEDSVTLGLNAGSEDEAIQLHTSLKDANSDVERTVYWQSEDENIVTVDSMGRLTPVAPGRTTVTAFLCNTYGEPCIGSADTCEVIVRESELQFYGLRATDEWGYGYTEIRMRSVDATRGVLADLPVGSINDSILGERFVAYELENGNIYCELSTMLDGVSVCYNLYELKNGVPSLVQSVYDPGYTSAVGLYDGQTDAEILCYEGMYSWQSVEAEYRIALENALSASGLRFDQLASIHSRDLRNSREYASADLSGAKLLFCAESRDELPTLLELSGMGALKNDELITIAPVSGISASESGQYTESKEGDTAAVAGSVVTTGDVNVRTGPGLAYDSIGVVSKGGRLSYLGEISTDERGVDWYKVSYNDCERWVSSTYSALTD